MKETKIIISVLLVLVLVFSIYGCSLTNNKKYVSLPASDLLEEDFGIAVTKGNTKLLNAVNEVIDAWLEDGSIDAYIEYYNALYSAESGETTEKPNSGNLKTSWTFKSDAEELIMYTESGFAPYEFVSNNNVVGLDAAIMSQVAENMGLKLVIKDVAFDTIPTFVESAKGNAVGAAGMTITESRAEIVDFSNVYSSSTIVVVSSEDKSYSSVRDLANMKVGVQEGTSGDLIISDAIKADGYNYTDYDDNDNEITKTVKITSSEENIKRYKHYALAFADLKSGRIDAILMDKLPAEAMLKGIN